jgi:hypothetical protein
VVDLKGRSTKDYKLIKRFLRKTHNTEGSNKKEKQVKVVVGAKKKLKNVLLK